MAFVQSLSLINPLSPPQPHFRPTKNLIFTLLPLKNRGSSLTILARSAPKLSLSATDQDILEAVLGSEEKVLPCVRRYENDLARLTLVGAVDFQQAITAAAADGGEAAAEHIASGIPAMVVETVLPVPDDEHSTISTRLFLPAKKVKEKARRLRNTLTDDILSGTSSRNILAMTFRQVVLQQLWNFELVLFVPGAERNMDDLENPREVLPFFTLSSSDERVISVLAEVVALCALESTERNFLDNFLGEASYNIFHWLGKPKRIMSTDSSVIISKLLEDEIVTYATSLLETYNSEKENHRMLDTKLKYNWWTSTSYSKLEKIGGPEFSIWTSEYIPAYRLQFNTDKLNSVELEGCKEVVESRLEILLTHHQMVGLASTLDMYYEDQFTLPNKQLLCGLVAKSTNLSIKKKNSSLLKMLFITLVSGLLLVTINILGQLCLPYLFSGRKYAHQKYSPLKSNVQCLLYESLESTKLDTYCISIVRRIKDAFDWPGEVMIETGAVAWTGELPEYLRGVGNTDSSDVDISSTSSVEHNEEMKASAQDIASYQVVLSADGKIVGFQPTNRVAVNHWAANPLAKEMYGRKKLTPGFIEPGLKISQPSGVVLVELLMSVNPSSYFAFARPIQP